VVGSALNWYAGSVVNARVTIVPYRQDHKTAFDRLNRQWLESFGLMEAADEADLANPEEAFLVGGGAIFVAECGNTAIGVCGVRHGHAGEYEIANLAVDPQQQRQGVGRRLVQHSIDAARTLGARQIVLVSNSRLSGAIALYESLGFVHQLVPQEFRDTYQTADIYMTLNLQEPTAVAEARTVLAATPATLDAWLRHAPGRLVTANEGGDTWSPFDVLGHLIHGEKTDWIPRLQMIVAHGESRAFEPFDRFAQFNESKGRTLAELLDEFGARRAESLSTLAAMQLTDADLDRRGRHPALGVVTLRQLLSTWVAHDLDHIVQIARVLAYQYRDDVGPWKNYLRVISGTQG
jgi:ribosomal protein S18 acetylase RimI-like enzyme